MANMPSSTFGSKLQAQDNIASLLANRPSHSHFEYLFPMYVQPTARKLAQPDSIQAIIRDNSGTRLYVTPIAWTSNQLQALSCQFLLQSGGGKPKKQVQPASQDLDFQNDTGGMGDNVAQRKPVKWRWSRAIRPVSQLGRLACLETKRSFVAELLGAYNIHHSE